MDENKYLIIIDGDDKTKEVQYYKKDDSSYNIKYHNGKREYPYSFKRVQIKDSCESLDIINYDYYYKNQLLLNIEKILKFDDIIKVFYDNGDSRLFFSDDIVEGTKANSVVGNVMDYYKEISKYVSDGDKESNDHKNTFLYNEYSKLNYVHKDSILNVFLNKYDLSESSDFPCNVIFPFGFNNSQKEAVLNVFKSNISIIEGPPGTGKTFTILNLIINLAFVQNKKVAVVSNNNEAVKNVKQKLTKYGFDFILASLGKFSNRDNFFSNLPEFKVDDFFSDDDIDDLFAVCKGLEEKLDVFLNQNKYMVELERKIDAFCLEQKHFDIYYKNWDIEEIEKLSFYNKSDDEILDLIADLQSSNGSINLFWKIKMYLKHGLKNLDKGVADYILMLQREYYELKLKRLRDEYNFIKNELKSNNFDQLKQDYCDVCIKILKKLLYQRYVGKECVFTNNNYKNNMEEFMSLFPIVLSTTYSLRNSIPKDFLFDYVIIDESSQVDLLAGCLALSCAKNAVIVGDSKQLPQIVDNKIKRYIGDRKVDVCHDYFCNNILSAMHRLYDDYIPSTVLLEHYRCHPKIIEFCNRRYYDGRLVAYEQECHKDVKNPLVLYYTVSGCHMRRLTWGNKGVLNERELEVIKKEILDDRVADYSCNDIGIVTPYRLQADNISASVDEGIESDTVHKYQGREKDLVIMSTVIDSSLDGKKCIKFVDDPCMVNVSISRAIKQFVLVTDNKLFNENGNEIKAFIKYIKYNTLDSEIVDSNLVSIFDLLYKDYSKKLDSLNKRLLHRLRYRSENIMDTVLDKIFMSEKFKDFKYLPQVLLKNCIKSYDNLSFEEKRYIDNNASFDFVIYDSMCLKPVLFIEVDGFAFHFNNPVQLKKDRLKDSIAKKNNICLLRFRTDKLFSEEDVVNIILNALGI